MIIYDYTVCNVNGVTHRDKATNDHQTALLFKCVSFSLVFWFYCSKQFSEENPLYTALSTPQARVAAPNANVVSNEQNKSSKYHI